MELLFVHGADGFEADLVVAHELSGHVGAPVTVPRMPDDKSVEAWAQPLRTHLARLGPDDVVVGHSFGGTILEWVLAEGGWSPRRAVFMAIPDWTPEGWDVAEYACAGPPPGMEVTLHHCRDDEVVPVEHLRLNASRMPGAATVEHSAGGHQFDGALAAVASRLR